MLYDIFSNIYVVVEKLCLSIYSIKSLIRYSCVICARVKLIRIFGILLSCRVISFITL